MTSAQLNGIMYTVKNNSKEVLKMKFNEKITDTEQQTEIKKELPLYVASGSPSDDTLRHYNAEIDNFLMWCNDNNYDPLKDVEDREAFQYLHFLNSKKYSNSSISIKIAAAKTFYFVAHKLKLFGENPFEDVKPKKTTSDDTDFHFYTTNEIKKMVDYVIERNDKATQRDLAIIMLMAVEGLRTVEVHRMNDQDIDYKNNRILIHGKGRDSYIYPCIDTFTLLKKYIENRPSPVTDEFGTPTFIGYSQKFFGERISRNGLRFTVNSILRSLGMKQKGDSCHVLRHSCGTNLYNETKDLRLVQETLRHTDPNTTARYTHILERIEDRQTKKISPLSNQ